MMRQLLFVVPLFASITVLTANIEVSDSYAEISESQLNAYDEELVTPIEIHPYDSHIEYNTTHKVRQKRSLDSLSRQFSFKGFGKNFHLQLEPTNLLLAPGFRVYHRRNFKTSKEEISKEKLDCLYVGTSKNHPRSTVALNLCGGLTGMIKTKTEDYLIEPSPDRRDGSASHVLRKRSVAAGNKTRRRKSGRNKENVQTHYCGKKRRYMPHKPSNRNHWLPDEFDTGERLTRAKRSTVFKEDQPRNVETLVVADRDMVLKHGAENVTTYVLTVFNMVAMLYQDATIANNVSVILVGLVLLEGDEPGLTLSHNAEKSLNSFCQWQSTIHTSKGTQHDHAVLVTGKDICSWKEEPCDTLGYAPISGMCSKYRSCTVNEDSGLALAFTIAHEIGHNFGMIHDGQGSSSCGDVRGTIMSPSLSGLDTAVLWSYCSRRDLAIFLKSPRALCLNNKPDFPNELKFPDRLPGELYDGDMQCKFQFSTKSRLCRHYANKDEICRSLWCENGRKCETKFLPAAEGTICGENKWCRKGSCVRREVKTLLTVDGGWGAFSEWSNCSSKCGGGGLKYRERNCDSPAPKNGGSSCKGKSKEYAICSSQPCTDGESDLHSDHCATFNQRTVKGKHYKWKPYTKDLGALARCRIYCAPDKEDLYLVLSTKLSDGVSCQGNYSSVCVDGECRPVGCDGKVDSDIMPDRCGVCNGDNSTCKVVAGTFVTTNLSRGYHEVVKIPRGSRHINVSEAKDYPTYLALRNGRGRYYLNGNWAVHWPGRYMAGGTVFSYRLWPGQPESFVSKGPINEELTVEVLVQEQKYAVLNYEFVISVPRTKWRFYNSSCSVTCGKGIITSEPKCMDIFNNMLENEQCGSEAPPFRTYTCNHLCPTTWKVGPWSDCLPQSCKRSGWQRRVVLCVQNNQAVNATLCDDSTKPSAIQRCFSTSCSYVWVTGPWLPCSVSCGRGLQVRNVSCVPMNADVTSYKKSHTCDEEIRPSSTMTCIGTSCNSVSMKGCKNLKKWCSSLANPKLCSRATYARNCCETCRSFG